MGNDESHLNVSLIVRDKVTTETVSTNHILLEEKGQPKRNQAKALSAYQPNALPPGQAGSLRCSDYRRYTITVNECM